MSIRSLLLLTSLGLLATPLVAQQQLSPAFTGPTSFTSGPAHFAATPFGGGNLQQTLGPWELTPPDTASIVVNTGTSFGWLNTANVGLSIGGAMGSRPIENGAFANAAIGDVVEVVFSNGVTNGPGADLVMLDAQFDIGLYSIRSDFDGFVASAVADTTNGTLVASVGYFYEFNGGGPFLADVYAVEVDLSAMGVPSGATVNALRFTCDSAGCDPVSLAKIGSSFTLSVSTLTAGSLGTFDITGGTAFGNVGIGYSLTGNNPTLIDTGACGFLTFNLTPPIGVLTILPADAAGAMSLSVTVPAGGAGLTVHFQALDFGSCSVSNGVSVLVL